MKLELNNLLAALAEALDCVEAELLGVKSNHSKRVAIMCAAMAREYGMDEHDIAVLVANAALHDNALNEYRRDYYDEAGNKIKNVNRANHCIAGEKNLEDSRIFKEKYGYVLYHHECADGTGPLGKSEAETPLGAKLIHIADQVDGMFALNGHFEGSLADVREFVEKKIGTEFGEGEARCLLKVLDEGLLKKMADENVEDWQDTMCIKRVFLDLSQEQIYALSGLFARIIDFKSPFTQNHSLGIADKARQMAIYYDFGAERAAELYFAGALHDIGKLAIKEDILEKPGLLEDDEYKQIQSHAYYTYKILGKIKGLEKLTRIAALHHERLDGKGYPFGMKAEQLDKEERLLACLDIYQALTEDRPYKAGMSHKKAVGILRELAEKGQLDAGIIEDIDKAFFEPENCEDCEKQAIFQCKVCGYIYEGDVMPRDYVCPVCEQAATAFMRIF